MIDKMGFERKARTLFVSFETLSIHVWKDVFWIFLLKQQPVRLLEHFYGRHLEVAQLLSRYKRRRILDFLLLYGDSRILCLLLIFR